MLYDDTRREKVFTCHSEERSDEESGGTVRLRFLATLRMTAVVRLRFLAVLRMTAMVRFRFLAALRMTAVVRFRFLATLGMTTGGDYM
jgi:hypothetical protein